MRSLTHWKPNGEVCTIGQVPTESIHTPSAESANREAFTGAGVYLVLVPCRNSDRSEVSRTICHRSFGLREVRSGGSGPRSFASGMEVGLNPGVHTARSLPPSMVCGRGFMTLVPNRVCQSSVLGTESFGSRWVTAASACSQAWDGPGDRISRQGTSMAVWETPGSWMVAPCGGGSLATPVRFGIHSPQSRSVARSNGITFVASGTTNPSRLAPASGRGHRWGRQRLRAGVARDRRVVHLEERVLGEVLRVEVHDHQRGPGRGDAGEACGVDVARPRLAAPEELEVQELERHGEHVPRPHHIDDETVLAGPAELRVGGREDPGGTDTGGHGGHARVLEERAAGDQVARVFTGRSSPPLLLLLPRRNRAVGW